MPDVSDEELKVLKLKAEMCDMVVARDNCSARINQIVQILGQIETAKKSKPTT